MDFSDITIYDFLSFGAILIALILCFILTLATKGALRGIFAAFSIILFLASPFLNIIIMDNFINKISLNAESSHRLRYTENYFLSAIITNNGRKMISHCRVGLYINARYPLNPDFSFVFENLNLSPAQSTNIEKMIENVEFDDINAMKIRCF